MTTEHDPGEYVLVHKSKAKISRTRKGIIGLMAVGAIAAIAGSGTFASFSASTTNDATFNSGTLILSNRVDTGQTCFSSRTGVDTSSSSLAANDASLDANDTDCDNLMSTALEPGGEATANVTLRNEGNTDGVLKAFRSEACVAGAFTGTSEIQRIVIDADGGTFTVAYDGGTTAALAHDITTADLQTALEGLAGIGSGNVTVTGAASDTYTITFAGALATTNLDALVVDDGQLTIGAGAAGTGSATLTTVREGAGTSVAGSKVADLCDRIEIQIQEVVSVGGAEVAGECVLPAAAALCGTNFTAIGSVNQFGSAYDAGTLAQGEERYFRIKVKMLQTTGSAACSTSLGVAVVDTTAEDGFVDATGQGCDNPYMNGQAATAFRWQLQLS